MLYALALFYGLVALRGAVLLHSFRFSTADRRR